jgi:uncharacterized membrane protein
MSTLPANKSSAPHDYHAASSVEELTEQNVKAIVKLDEAARKHRSFADRVAAVVARFCGSILFLWTHVAWFTGWILVNSLPGGMHFDPYPFTFLTFVVSLEAIFLSTFILISQNMETRLSERRNHLDLQINLLAEQENTKMLNMLTSIARAVGANVSNDPEAQVLEQATRPANLVDQIETALEQTDHTKAASGG